jgi:hypothetical protein
MVGARMADRPRHPNKKIEAAVAYAEQRGWSWLKVKGHAWGKLYCPHHGREGCIVFVWSTPRVPENHARQIRREVDRCPHKERGEDDENV